MLRSSEELRHRAEEFRQRAHDSTDPWWEVTCVALAEEFEAEAREEDRLMQGMDADQHA